MGVRWGEHICCHCLIAIPVPLNLTKKKALTTAAMRAY